MSSNQAAMTALINEYKDPTKEEREYYNCITLYKMAEICLREQFAKQILYIFPRILNDNDHNVFHVSSCGLMDTLKYSMHEIISILFEDQEKIENIWSITELTMRTDVGRNMSYYIKWFRSQIDLKNFMLDNVHEIFKLVVAKNKETMAAYEKIEKLQRNVGAYAVRRLQRQQNVWYHER